MSDAIELAEKKPPQSPEERFTNLVALTIAILASFVVFTNIKSGNVAEAMQQAQAERNNGWAWYQAVRVREDMATYEMANLQRLARAPSVRPAEAARLAEEMTAQQAEIDRIRARLAETRGRAEQAEVSYAALNGMGDQYDFTEALITIAITILAVTALTTARWLFIFALVPGIAGVIIGTAAMMGKPLPLAAAFALVG
jgi:hypothetical protein